MNAIFTGDDEIIISLHAKACAELLQQLRQKKRSASANGLLPGSITLRSDIADGAQQKTFFAQLKARSLFQRRPRWPEVEYLHTLTVSKGHAGLCEHRQREVQLRLPPEEWRLFCAALEHFLAGHWLFFIELPSCGMVVSFVSHGSPEADSHSLMEDGRFTKSLDES